MGKEKTNKKNCDVTQFQYIYSFNPFRERGDKVIKKILNFFVKK